MRKFLENYALKGLKINENSETEYIFRTKILIQSKIKEFCGQLSVKWRSSAHSGESSPWKLAIGLYF